jgi:dienelactone hydrolase
VTIKTFALCICAAAAINSAHAAVAESRGSYNNDGRKILVEQYEPAATGKHPALILLHGSGGVLFPGLDLRRRARSLAAEGYAVYIPHFFNRTSHFMVRPSQVHENLPTWTRTVQDCVTFVSTQPNVDANRIGLLGHSLGGYLSLSTAAVDRRIKVVVEASGALDVHGIKRMPPTLILHGAKDKTVPVDKAEKLEMILRRAGATYQKHIYPDEPHLFSRAAMQDISVRIDAFLRRYFPVRTDNV